MGIRHDSEPRPTTEVDPAQLRELLARQERFATSSEQIKPQPKATVQMTRQELLGLREACTDEASRPAVEEVKANRTTNLGIEPVQWRRPKTVVGRRPSAFLIVAALACAGLLSLAVALLALR